MLHNIGMSCVQIKASDAARNGFLEKPITEEEIKRVFSRNLRRVMQLQKHDEDSLAEATGVSVDTVKRWLRASHAPKWEHLVNVCNALRVGPEVLFAADLALYEQGYLSAQDRMFEQVRPARGLRVAEEGEPYGE